MDPVQRIPRYTLMFRNMIKRMAPDDPQRAKLIEADEIASKIALAETDEQTKRAQVMYCLSATIDSFPPALISNSRRFVDCIDVEDVIFDSGSGSGNQSQASDSLHCSLFLFDDKLLIVKRPGHGEKGARALTGINDLDKLTKSGNKHGVKKSGMSSKGVVEVIDVVVTDVGGSGMCSSYVDISTVIQHDYRFSSIPRKASA
jgi:protein ECT2